MASPPPPVNIRDFAYPASDPRHFGLYQPADCHTAPTTRPPSPATSKSPSPVATPPKRRVRTLAEVHSQTLNSRKRLRVDQERTQRSSSTRTSASWDDPSKWSDGQTMLDLQDASSEASPADRTPESDRILESCLVVPGVIRDDSALKWTGLEAELDEGFGCGPSATGHPELRLEPMPM
uniref:Uncharacterized protein n=1 Tax=Mycena chlorophos TaxID=658473 RepID=A0ABQ0LG11_MYCCL|nr:predicted protein [Mycena chlorophos]